MILPFTYPWFFRRFLNDSKTVLDVGCGDGTFMALINKDGNFKITGVEIFPEYVKRAKETGVYEKVIEKDVMKINFSPKSFDAAVCSQVIEHLKKPDGIKLISKISEIAKEVVIIGTPNGHYSQGVYDENVYQKHLSEWRVEDFQKMGFKVYGQATKLIYGEKGYLRSWWAQFVAVRYLLYIISYIFSWIGLVWPNFGAHLIAVKYK